MLHSIRLNDQSYEEMFAEALSRVPLYTKEWTNFNPSDPGITMLQNLTAFSLLQQSLIDKVTDAMRLKLLGLLGFTPQKLCEAKLLVSPEVLRSGVLPAHEKLMLGSLCFETDEDVELVPWMVSAMYASVDGTLRDLTYALQHKQSASVQVFGAEPKAGDELYCVLDGPVEAGMTLHFHIEVTGEEHRNPFDEADDLSFARYTWQYYTADGWKEVQYADETHHFLTSGGLHITLGGLPPVVYSGLPVQGLVLRCTLDYADYDIPPRVLSITGGLFEVRQRSTKAASFLCPWSGTVRIHSAMLRNENLFVFCRETPGGPYFLYEQAGRERSGRVYQRRDLPGDVTELNFDLARSGHMPIDEEDAVCVVCYDIDALNQRFIGTAYGYEDQSLDVPGMSSILPERFSVLAEVPDPDGQGVCYRIEPGDTREDSLLYEVDASEGALHIIHNGLGSAARLFVCDCAVTAGDAGNVRPGANLSSAPDPYFPNEPKGPYYFAPGAGKGGRSQESIEQMRQRFIRTLRSRSSAVTEHDYEEAVRTTPGLCIHKVRAVADERNNLVKVTVKCYTEQDRRTLPACYVERIKRRLDEYRMIATRVELCQPQYVPINVAAVIHVRNYYKNARQEIERLLRDELDYVSTDHGFGETIRFTELYNKLERMDCVDRIYSLTLHPAPGSDAVMAGADICLGKSSLCRLGWLTLELNTSFAR